MDIQQIRQKTAYNASAKPTQKQATRTWLNSLHKQYPLALTLTLKQSICVRNVKGEYYKRLDKDDIKQIARHFTHKLNKQVFGSSAKRYGRGLKYLAVIEGERSNKNLHIHMAIGGLPDDVKWNEVDSLVRNAKLSVDGLDEQHKVDIVDSGWMEYITKELGMKDTDNVLWDLM
ncbi:hypothetical protein [Polynucleobacter sp. AP-Kaivos-20-H2]|uniref:rolling circle replication-associated protein n=1 Tax=Polynucleobacter sp. AP-Kaivos-20-H2 TaxID=2689104 RepID=UPI001C0D9A96|nr:hypothetical protein [Polynucleobacter sp. AP-Kaivos-20-H2]MBU3603473.1 hypothetical protein [Polynucleobacter sp. AP-Kaivos-20-H2]